MGREYKKCGRCHKFFLLETYSKSNSTRSKDGYVSFCPECEKKHNKVSKVSDSKIDGRKEKENNLLARQSMDSEYSIVACLPDMVIIEELRNRGYKGKLTISKEINI